MSINYIGSSGLGQIGHIKATGMSSSKESGAVDGPGFSSMLKAADQSAKAEESAAAERAAKVAALKQQVEAGAYQPDLKQVASSLAYFLLEGE